MEKVGKIIKISLFLYLALYLIQLGFYVFAPSFYISSPDQLDIPKFIIGAFVKYFTLTFILYIFWALILGGWNALLLKFNRPRWEHKHPNLSYWALTFAQFFGVALYLGYLYPAVLNNYPGLRSLPLIFSYGLLATSLGLAAFYFLRYRTQALSRGVAQIILSLLFPILILTGLNGSESLNIQFATADKSVSHPYILLLGLDALDGDTGNGFLEKKLEDKKAVLYRNAFTTLPLTHPAWNSILTGLYPEGHGVRYFFDSPLTSEHPLLFLPNLLKNKGGYQSLFASDQPETSYFTKEKGFDAVVIKNIGWEAHMVAMILNHFVFPALWLNNRWVDRIAPDYFNHASIFNFDLNRFTNRSFEKLNQMGNGPKFMAFHTCYLHTPVRLNRQELKQIPRYWTLAPKDFSFEKWPKPGKPQKDTPTNWINPYYLRRTSVVGFLDNLLQELKDKKYLDLSTVVLLSDHGERFVKGREIYGGVHGVDLETREQTNVVLAFLDPNLEKFHTENQPVSLIDIAPTIAFNLGIDLKDFPFDGVPLLNKQGQPKRVGIRPIWIESMGYINDAEEKVKFPQIPVKTLEQSLEYGENGTVMIGADYYARILEKKEREDFSKKASMLFREGG